MMHDDLMQFLKRWSVTVKSAISSRWLLTDIALRTFPSGKTLTASVYGIAAGGEVTLTALAAVCAPFPRRTIWKHWLATKSQNDWEDPIKWHGVWWYRYLNGATVRHEEQKSILNRQSIHLCLDWIDVCYVKAQGELSPLRQLIKIPHSEIEFYSRKVKA